MHLLHEPEIQNDSTATRTALFSSFLVSCIIAVSRHSYPRSWRSSGACREGISASWRKRLHQASPANLEVVQELLEEHRRPHDRTAVGVLESTPFWRAAGGRYDLLGTSPVSFRGLHRLHEQQRLDQWGSSHPALHELPRWGFSPAEVPPVASRAKVLGARPGATLTQGCTRQERK